MEGRDIGTVVFPHAEVKIFLDAAPEVRGLRRFDQLDQLASSRRAQHACIHEEVIRDSARPRRARPQPRRLAAQAGRGRRSAGFNRHDAGAGGAGRRSHRPFQTERTLYALDTRAA